MAAVVPWAAFLLLAGEIDINATVVAEARGGQAPQRVGAAPTAGFASVLTPGAGVQVLRTDLDASLDYQARIFWRQPNELSRTSPLLFHVANLSLMARATPTVTITAGALASFGEVDYTALPQLLAPSTGTAPPSMGTAPPSIGGAQAMLPVVAEIFSGSARAGLEVAASRTWRYSVPLELGYRQPIGADTGSMPPGMVSGFLQRQASVALNPTVTGRLSRRDELLLITSLANRWFENGVDFLTVAPQVGWRHRFTPTDDLRFSVGAAYGRHLGVPPVLGSRSSVSPIGNAEATWLLLRHRGVGMQGAVGTAVEYFVDPILAQAYPRGSVYARALLFVGDDWTVAFEGALGTSLREVPPRLVDTPPPDQTVASIALPVRYRASPGLVIEFGVRWSDRAPHFGGSLFEFHQRQFWLYTSLTATTRETGRWNLPDLGDGDRRNRPLPLEEPQEPDRQGRSPDQRAQ